MEEKAESFQCRALAVTRDMSLCSSDSVWSNLAWRCKRHDSCSFFSKQYVPTCRALFVCVGVVVVDVGAAVVVVVVVVVSLLL